MLVHPSALVLLGSLLGIGLVTHPRHLPRPSPCGPCRATNNYLYPNSPAPHAALRFVSQGKLLSPPSFFAEYSSWPDADRADRAIPEEQEQLRFGTIYLAKGPLLEPEGKYYFLQSVYCVRGRDTMQVYVQPLANRFYCYDSIPFRPGRYELIEPPLNILNTWLPYGQLASMGITPISFAAYYQQHQAELARDNPFAGCRFSKSGTSPAATSQRYVPRQPTEIFNLLLAHTTYLKITGWHLRPLAPHEQVAAKD